MIIYSKLTKAQLLERCYNLDKINKSLYSENLSFEKSSAGYEDTLKQCRKSYQKEIRNLNKIIKTKQANYDSDMKHLAKKINSQDVLEGQFNKASDQRDKALNLLDDTYKKLETAKEVIDVLQKDVMEKETRISILEKTAETMDQVNANSIVSDYETEEEMMKLKCAIKNLTETITTLNDYL